MLVLVRGFGQAKPMILSSDDRNVSSELRQQASYQGGSGAFGQQQQDTGLSVGGGLFQDLSDAFS